MPLPCVRYCYTVQHNSGWIPMYMAPIEEDPNMRNSFLFTTSVVTLIGLTTVGCVRHDRYDTARTATLSLQEQLVAAQTERDASQSSLALKERQLAQAESNLTALQGEYDMLATELDAIDTENNSLLTTVTSIKFGPLPIDVQQKLAALAASYPNDMWFDAETGMIRFGSDFTFSSGRATLKDGAQDVISRVASILNTDAASNLEIVVVGHTDNVQPKSSAQRYPTNWELSTARSVSVVKGLASNGVDPARFEVAGCGEYRPLVPNVDGGTKENRRVEIYLRPMKTADTWDPSSTSISETVGVDTTEEPMK